MSEHEPASNAPFPFDAAREGASGDDDEQTSSSDEEDGDPKRDPGAQNFGPRDVARSPSAGEGSASDEPESSERSERDQHQGSASDEPESSEPQASETGITSEQSERDQLIIERDAFKELSQRVQADFVNYRKRSAAQSAADVERATGRLAEALLPVLDAAEAAYLRHPDEVGPLLNAMLSELRKQGLEMVDLEDKPFDPEVADAVAHEPGGGGEAVVTEVLRSGYRWKGKTLRPAMVRTKD